MTSVPSGPKDRKECAAGAALATQLIARRFGGMLRDIFLLRERARQYRRQAENATDLATVRRLLQMAEDLEEEVQEIEKKRRTSG